MKSALSGSVPEGPECLYTHVHRQKPNRHNGDSTISRSRELLYVGKTLVFLSLKDVDLRA